jgi:hypothetical protein
MVGFLFIGLASLFNALGQPFQGNQNQYLYFATAKSELEKSDPLYNTTDIYPVFTILSKALIEAFGLNGLRLGALIGTYIALLSVNRISRLLCAETKSNVPYIVVFLVSFTMLPSYFWEKNSGTLELLVTEGSIFFGLGGHYLVSKPAYFQPNLFGVFLLLSFSFFLQGFMQRENQKKCFLQAIVFLSVAVITHPIYLVTYFICLLPLVCFELINGKNLARLFLLLKLSLVPIACSFVLNFKLYLSSFNSLWTPDVSQSESLRRFAFERIGHHTDIFQWPKTDIFIVVIILLGFYLTKKQLGTSLLFYWSSFLIFFSLVTAFLVHIFLLAPLGLLFPWRVTVLLFPIASTVILTFLVKRFRFKITQTKIRLSFGIMALSGVMMLLGNAKMLEFEDGAVSLIKQTRPIGLGLIPIDQENVRLNAKVPVYVDWKAAPYLGRDLELWWQRIDQIEGIAMHPQRVCEFLDRVGINWILLEETSSLAACESPWVLLGRNDHWVVMQRVLLK